MPVETRGNLPIIFFKLKETEKLLWFCRRREFVVDSGASMHIVSRKDFNSPELETVRISKKSDDGGNSQRRGAHKRRGNKEMFLEDTLAVLSLGKLCEEHGFNYHWTSAQKPRLIKNGRKTDCNTANYVPFVVVVPGPSISSSISSSPTSPTSSSQESMIPTEHRASTGRESMSEKYRETCRMDQQKPKTETRMTTRKYEETCRMICHNGCRSSGTVW